MRRFAVIFVGVCGLLALLLLGEWVYERAIPKQVLLDTHHQTDGSVLRALREGPGRIRVMRGEDSIAVLRGRAARLTGGHFAERDGRLFLEMRDAYARVHVYDVERMAAMPDPGRALSERVLHPLWRNVGAPLSRGIAGVLPIAPPMTLYKGPLSENIVLSPNTHGFYVEGNREPDRSIRIFDKEGEWRDSIMPDGEGFLDLRAVDIHGRYILVESLPDIEMVSFSFSGAPPIVNFFGYIVDTADGKPLYSIRFSGSDDSLFEENSIEFSLASTVNVRGLSNFSDTSPISGLVSLIEGPEKNLIDQGRYELRLRADRESLQVGIDVIRTTDGEVVSQLLPRSYSFSIERLGDRFAFFGQDGSLEIRRASGLVATIPELTNTLGQWAHFSHDGDWLLARGTDGNNAIFDSRTGARLYGNLPQILYEWPMETIGGERVIPPMTALAREYRVLAKTADAGTQTVSLHDLRHLRGLLGWGQAWGESLSHIPARLLGPEPERPPLEIVIDPFGGGEDAADEASPEGGIDLPGSPSADPNLDLAFALRLAAELNKSDDLRAVLTREADVAVSREARNAFILERRPAAVIQIEGFGVRDPAITLQIAHSDEKDLTVLLERPSVPDGIFFSAVSNRRVILFGEISPDGMALTLETLPVDLVINDAAAIEQNSPDWQDSIAEILRERLEEWHDSDVSPENEAVQAQ